MRGSPDDSDDNRVLKYTRDSLHNNVERNTLYVFDSLEVRRAPFVSGTPGEYTLDSTNEVPYLFANGVRLARVMYESGIPLSTSSAQHVLFDIGDYLGSTSNVVDKATGELVEKVAYQAYGATDADFRPDRWDGFREDYRFTGKEEDVEVGLTYFGKRFYSANLGRWMSPDPLGVHEPGKADLNLYAYVQGRTLRTIDPRGLDPADRPVIENALHAATGGEYGSGTPSADATHVTLPSGPRFSAEGFKDAAPLLATAASLGASAGALSVGLPLLASATAGLGTKTIVGGVVGGTAAGTFEAMKTTSDAASIATEITGGAVSGMISVHAPGGPEFESVFISGQVNGLAAVAGSLTKEFVNPGSIKKGIGDSISGSYASTAIGAIPGGSTVAQVARSAITSTLAGSAVAEAYSHFVSPSPAPAPATGAYDTGPLDGGTCHE